MLVRNSIIESLITTTFILFRFAFVNLTCCSPDKILALIVSLRSGGADLAIISFS